MFQKLKSIYQDPGHSQDMSRITKYKREPQKQKQKQMQKWNKN